MRGPTQELARLVAYVFAATGRRRISQDDWVRIVSLERKWLPPSRARQAAEVARSQGLLRNAGARDYELGLEAQGLELPLDYRPDSKGLEDALLTTLSPTTPGASLFRRLVKAVSEKTGQSEAEIVGVINRTQQSLGGLLTAEVTALYYAALQGVDGSPFWDEVAATLQASPSRPRVD